MSTTVKERYMGEAPLNGRPDGKLGLVLKDGAVTTQKIADGAVTFEGTDFDLSMVHINSKNYSIFS